MLNNYKKLKFIFCIHNHQPVGNFDYLFRDAFRRCYDPFLSILDRFSGIKASIHYSGPVFEWAKFNNPHFFDKLNTLIEKGQIELLGGGFYEPILSLIPEEDAVGQILMQTSFMKEHLGVIPKGVWLTERVWAPSIPKILSKAGITYTIIDDTHISASRVTTNDISGYFITEMHGSTTALFPIDKTLRFSIPFKPHSEVFEYMKRKWNEGVDSVVFADDGEKFGLWQDSGTEGTWLEKFFSMILENSDWLETDLFSSYMKNTSPRGRIYIPATSYPEMTEWCLDTASFKKFTALKRVVEKWGGAEDALHFLRGGVIEDFFIKYPESNILHKKMLHLSKKITESSIEEGLKETALRELYKGECNCAYWHGIFGGLYIGHLRRALYKHLINAENIVDLAIGDDGIRWAEIDCDADGTLEVTITTPYLNITFDPDYGGTIAGFDYKEKGINIADVIARRKEWYHSNLSSPKDIVDLYNNPEEIPIPKKKGCELYFDTYLRRISLDHIFAEGTSLENLIRCDYTDISGNASSPYSYEIDRTGNILTLKREALLKGNGRIKIVKQFFFNKDKAAIYVIYNISNEEPVDIRAVFGVELNIAMTGGGPDQVYYYSGSAGKTDFRSSGELTGNAFAIRDILCGIDVSINTKGEYEWWYFPIKTVSQSEHGIEEIYQGAALVPHFHIDLKDKKTYRFEMEIAIMNNNLTE